MSLAELLARCGGSGTDCVLPLSMANSWYRNRRFAGTVLVSDQESWVYRGRTLSYGRQGATGFLEQLRSS